MLKKLKGALVALPAVAMSSAALAGDFGTGVVAVIDEQKPDMILIGVAVLGIVVLIAAIGWAVRASRK